MRYKIKPIEQEAVFAPFSITLTFETKEEYVEFHDKIMSQITGKCSHELHQDFYQAGHGAKTVKEGKI